MKIKESNHILRTTSTAVVDRASAEAASAAGAFHLKRYPMMKTVAIIWCAIVSMATAADLDLDLANLDELQKDERLVTPLADARVVPSRAVTGL